MVTGGAQGIGAAIAERLAAEGATVAIGDLKQDQAAEVADRIGGSAGELDVTSVDSVSAFVAEHGQQRRDR
jgi:3-oxoacyl-[acyl-carrier protein] reductase/pyridoxal 4-dehydrogenase